MQVLLVLLMIINISGFQDGFTDALPEFSFPNLNINWYSQFYK